MTHEERAKINGCEPISITRADFRCLRPRSHGGSSFSIGILLAIIFCASSVLATIKMFISVDSDSVSVITTPDKVLDNEPSQETQIHRYLNSSRILEMRQDGHVYDRATGERAHP